MHKYLSDICNEKNSGLKGLKYEGGPGMDVTCSRCSIPGVRLPPYVNHSSEQQTESDTSKCERKAHLVKLEDVLKVKRNMQL